MYREARVDSDPRTPAPNAPGTGSPHLVQTPDNVAVAFATAGLGSRMLAQMVDTVLAGVTVVVAVLIYLVIAGTDGRLVITGAIGVATATYILYFAAWEIASGGTTAGKQSLGLRVMRIDGGAARTTDLVIRNVLRLVDVGLGGVGLIVMFFHPRSRRLGDLAAGTLVVRTPPAVSLNAAVRPQPVMLRTPDEGPAIDGLGRLGSHELEVLRAFLSHPGLAPDRRTSLAQGMARTLLDRMGLGPAAPERGWPPELFLERLYLQLARRRA